MQSSQLHALYKVFFDSYGTVPSSYVALRLTYSLSNLLAYISLIFLLCYYLSSKLLSRNKPPAKVISICRLLLHTTFFATVREVFQAIQPNCNVSGIAAVIIIIVVIIIITNVIYNNIIAIIFYYYYIIIAIIIIIIFPYYSLPLYCIFS